MEKEFGNEIIATLVSDQNGFKAKPFRNGDIYILAFTGTGLRDDEGNFNHKDTATDGKQVFGLDNKEDGQYIDAISLSDTICSKIEEDNERGKNKKFIATRHLLGGGLMTIGGMATGADTYAFSAAGVHDQTFRDQEVNTENIRHIQVYYSDKDPLNIT